MHAMIFVQRAVHYLHAFSFTGLILEQEGCPRTSDFFVPYLAVS